MRFMQLDLTPSHEVAKSIPKLERRTRKKRVLRYLRESLSLKSEVQDVKPWPIWAGVLGFGALAILGMSAGAMIMTHVFFGLCALFGLIAITESNKWVRWWVYRSNKAVDLMIFVASIVASVAMGVTISAGLTFAGLGYTLVYAPYIRKRREISNL